MKLISVLLGILLIIAGTAVATHQRMTQHQTIQEQKMLGVGPLETSVDNAACWAAPVA